MDRNFTKYLLFSSNSKYFYPIPNRQDTNVSKILKQNVDIFEKINVKLKYYIKGTLILTKFFKL
jgi:hypothetical protein